MLNLTRLHLGIAHESQFQGLGITCLLEQTVQCSGLLPSSAPVCRRAGRRSRQIPTANPTMYARGVARIRRARDYSRGRCMQFANEAAPWSAAAYTAWR